MAVGRAGNPLGTGLLPAEPLSIPQVCDAADEVDGANVADGPFIAVQAGLRF